MLNKKIKISGTGCALADFVYNNINFNCPEFLKYRSSSDGDGGLTPGKLVFTEELEKFAGKPYPKILQEITGDKQPETFNVGGPSIVTLIHAAQLLTENEFEVDFYGISGKDETSKKIRELLKKTPLDIQNYRAGSEKPTPFTHVLSDPEYDGGHGERTFINNIGAARNLTTEFLPESFFEADIVCFGGTALTPNLHDSLHLLLKKAQIKGALTIVNTVYDFRSEKENPQKAWPLGNTEQSFPNIDLLIMDHEEARRISGCENVNDIVHFFKKKLSAFIITRGSNSILLYSSGENFENEFGELPVSKEVREKIGSRQYKGDTTGCGDNFVGGVIVSVAKQLQNENKKLNLKEAAIYGICSGGFACSYHGGTWYEVTRGEKKKKIELLVKAYKQQ